MAIMLPLFMAIAMFTLFYLVTELLISAAHEIWSAANDD